MDKLIVTFILQALITYAFAFNSRGIFPRASDDDLSFRVHSWLGVESRLYTWLVDVVIFIFRCLLSLFLFIVWAVCMYYIMDFLGTKEQVDEVFFDSI